MKCPNCGAQASGKFCAECGTALESGRCASCNAKLITNARFCTQCGTRVKGVAGNNAPWYVAGAGVLALIAVLLVPIVRGTSGESAPPAQAQAPTPMEAAPAEGGGPPALSGNMRENADRLFNRVMQTREKGDTAGAKFFVPMAVQAYQSSGELDADGLYHLSVLQTFGGDPAGGRQSAEQILKTNPNHILGLAAAASAAREQKDNAAARQYYEKLVAAFPTEKAKSLPEYQDHAALLPEIEAEAKAYLGR